MKTDRQMLLEIQHGRSVEELLRNALETHRGRRNLTMLVALNLELSNATVYNWCADLGIDIDEYRRPSEEENNDA